MANTWFQFKQFTIHHDRCAMKVTTDACLFGAWLAFQLREGKPLGNALDIGAGTGLLSLMLAQQLRGTSFTAVELDEAAATQAAENVLNSPFADKISVVQKDIALYRAPHPFNLVFSNPPFYENQLTSPLAEKNKAHHDESLTLQSLLQHAKELVADEGKLALLLPYYRKEEAIAKAAEHGFYPQKVCDVQQTPQHAYFRTMQIFGRAPASFPEKETIVIAVAPQQYSLEFVTLLKDYYLHL